MMFKIKKKQIENFQWKEEDYVEIMGYDLEIYLDLRGMNVIKDKVNLKLIIASNITVEIDYTPEEERGLSFRAREHALKNDYLSFQGFIRQKRQKYLKR